MKTLREFERSPSGLVLPHGLVVKRVEGARLVRVAWKIVRGLYRIENDAVLPDDTPFTTEFFEPQVAARSRQNPVWEAVKAQPGKGAYPGIFDYKYRCPGTDEPTLHAWGLLFWDKVIVFVGHHEPQR